MAQELKANAISLPGAIAMSIAIMAPAAGMMFIPQVVAQTAGGAVPLVYLISLVGSLFVANTIVQFSKRIPHAGSFFAYNAAGLGKGVGFFSGWLLFAGYFVFYPQNLSAAGYFASAALAQHFGIHISWIWFALIIAGVIWYLSVRGISSSMKTDLYFVSFEMLVILIVTFAIILKGGSAGNSAAVFTANVSPHGWGGIFFGMIFGMMTFMGFEAAATVAEETANPRRNIPRAIWGSVIGIGIFYVIVTYAITIGYGPEHGKALAATALPMDHLAQQFVSPSFSFAVDIAGIISAFAVSLALNNATVRVIYAMGRDGVMPKGLATTHKVFKTPAAAINLVGAAAVGLALVVGIIVGPYPNGYGYFGAFGTIPILILYILASISLVRYVKKATPGEFKVWSHGIAPAVGAVAMLLPLYGSIFPLPPFPYNLILGLIAVYIITGIILGYGLRKHKDDILTRIGKIAAGE